MYKRQGDGDAARLEAGRVPGDDLHVLVGDVDAVGPQRAGHPEVQLHPLAVQEGRELLDADAEQVAQGAGVAAEPDLVVLVHDAGEVRGDQVTAGGGVSGQAVGEILRHHVQDRGHEQRVRLERGAGRDDVHPDAGRGERRVPVERLLAVAQQRGGVGVELGGPPGVPVEDDGRLGGAAAGAGDGGERAEGRPEVGDVPEDLAVGAGVREHRRVVLLGAAGRLPPLEEADGVGAMGDVRERVAGQSAGRFGQVDRLPVDGAGGVLHEEPGPAARQVAGEVRRERQLVAGLRAGQQVVVVGDEVDLAGPVGVVHVPGLAHDHEVGGHRDAGGQLGQQVAFGAQVVLERVGGEAPEVELLGRVGEGGGQAGWQDLIPVAVLLRPERGRPGPVQLVDGAVTGAQPGAEGRGGVVGVVVGVVAAQLVGDVPGGQGRVVAVPFRHGPDQA